jgi:hypothetical protein
VTDARAVLIQTSAKRSAKPEYPAMSAEIIQFVPKPNPKRQEAEQRVAEAFNSLVGVWPDFSSAAAYHAPDKDSA